MKEWCEEAGEWIGEDDPNPLWWHACLGQDCPYFDIAKVIMEESKIYWAIPGQPPYDITYHEKFFCPIYKQYIYPEREICFALR